MRFFAPQVCNYSTTTKGNLSIHMQSDKHINNMQELQKGQPVGGAASVTSSPVSMALPPAMTQSSSVGGMEQKIPPSSPLPSPAGDVNMLRGTGGAPGPASMIKPSAIVKGKTSFRCDVCNYETSVARNLRIHMTSEKHTHNMMMMHQNVNTMQRDMQLQLNQMALLGKDAAAAGALFSLAPGALPPGMPPFPFDPGLMLQHAGMAAAGLTERPMDLTKPDHHQQQQQHHQDMLLGKSLDLTNNNSDPCSLYQCAICEVFSVDSLEALHAHMQLDRTKHGNEDHVTVINGTYLCNLCQYKTNLKANFQLHCKTDKHLQRLQLVNHIREGCRNPNSHNWHLKYAANISNPVQVRCNACNYYTNSIHKLQLHNTTPRHDANTKLFDYLQKQEAAMTPPTERKYYHCKLCASSMKTKLDLVEHIKTMTHARSEHLQFMALKEEGREDEYTFELIFCVRPLTDDDSVRFEEGKPLL